MQLQNLKSFALHDPAWCRLFMQPNKVLILLFHRFMYFHAFILLLSKLWLFPLLHSLVDEYDTMDKHPAWWKRSQKSKNTKIMFCVSNVVLKKKGFLGCGARAKGTVMEGYELRTKYFLMIHRWTLVLRMQVSERSVIPEGETDAFHIGPYA